jgi:hypothetical protein
VDNALSGQPDQRANQVPAGPFVANRTVNTENLDNPVSVLKQPGLRSHHVARWAAPRIMQLAVKYQFGFFRSTSA